MAFKRSFAILSLFAVSVFASPTNDAVPGLLKHTQPGDDNNCPPGKFYYQLKNTCLPHGGPPSTPSPPSGKSCPPTSHYWSKDFSCCVPNYPPPQNAPPPQCSNGHDWNQATQSCEPHRKPTHTHTHTHKPSQTPDKPDHDGDHDHHSGDEHGAHDTDGDNGNNFDYGVGISYGIATPAPTGKDGHSIPTPTPTEKTHGGKLTDHPIVQDRNNKKRSTAPLCPKRLEACTIGSGAEYECLDTTVELASCGGCVSTGKGQDCTAIEGALNVGCENSSCAVYTCARGFTIAADGKSCKRN